MKNRQSLAGTIALWLILAAAFFYASLGCAHPFDPGVDVVEFEAPAWYADTWVARELCTGLDGTFHRVRWFKTTTARMIRETRSSMMPVCFSSSQQSRLNRSINL